MKKCNLGIDGIWLTALLCLVALASQAQTVTTLATFTGLNGAYLWDPLVQGTDGNFYGTTAGGKLSGTFYPSTVFKMTPDGALTTIAELGHENTLAGLVQATNGDYYGATQLGGNGDGSIFKITPADRLKTVYQFCQSTCYGIEPRTTLIEALDRDLYGTLPGGFIYKVSLAGAFTALATFTGPNGSMPQSGVIQAADGNFYGTTTTGGQPCPQLAGGCGTVYQMTADGTLTTLHSFCAQTGCPDGLQPLAGLIQATDGNLYGLTQQGGSGGCADPYGCGVAFKISPNGTFTALATLGANGTAYPDASFVQATDGNFYAITGSGGLFQMTPAGVVTVLYLFSNDSSNAPLIQATDGNFYGTTYGAASNGRQVNAGTVFRLSMGLGPFVTVQPPAGPAGKTVTILGTNLAGTTSVTFNGTPVSSFTVNSTNSAITTTVPAGATTGTVQVTLPGTTLSSNVPFRVL